MIQWYPENLSDKFFPWIITPFLTPPEKITAQKFYQWKILPLIIRKLSMYFPHFYLYKRTILI